MDCYICATYRAELKTSDGIPICPGCYVDFVPENKKTADRKEHKPSEEPPLELKKKVETGEDIEFEWNEDNWLELDLDLEPYF